MVLRFGGVLAVGIIFTIVCISAVFIFPIIQPSLVSQLNAWKVLPQLESVTELYFEDHIHLPSKINSGDAISFRFTIHNLENKPVSYFYFISLENDTKVELLRDIEYLDHGDTRTLEVNLRDVVISTRSAIAVNIPEQNQRIHFWVEPK